MTDIEQEEIDKLLKSWNDLNAGIADLTEEALTLLIQIEGKKDKPRDYILKRLAQRRNKLRSQRELDDILKK